MRYRVDVNGEISCQWLADALSSVGLHLRMVNHQMFIDPIPKQFLKAAVPAEESASLKMRRVK